MLYKANSYNIKFTIINDISEAYYDTYDKILEYLNAKGLDADRNRCLLASGIARSNSVNYAVSGIYKYSSTQIGIQGSDVTASPTYINDKTLLSTSASAYDYVVAL